jgi:hypothetical protein
VKVVGEGGGVSYFSSLLLQSQKNLQLVPFHLVDDDIYVGLLILFLTVSGYGCKQDVMGA